MSMMPTEALRSLSRYAAIGVATLLLAGAALTGLVLGVPGKALPPGWLTPARLLLLTACLTGWAATCAAGFRSKVRALQQAVGAGGARKGQEEAASGEAPIRDDLEALSWCAANSARVQFSMGVHVRVEVDGWYAYGATLADAVNRLVADPVPVGETRVWDLPDPD